MTNRLASQNSPYLLQHKDNPVDWYPWGEEALSRAKAENKPIFLSIGYAACHWCHVMERESFENEQTADFLNAYFVSIKVDREERPDLDRIYMDAVVAITGQGGWPMSVFLTPDGKPIYGGTYFPPTRRYGIPSFMDVLQNVASLWQEKPEELEQSAQNLTQHLLSRSATPSPDDEAVLDPDTLEQASLKIAQSYDQTNGGWGQAPKFPQPMTIEYLLRRASQGDSLALDLSQHALNAMSKGGMYDLVGGGFARYSVDDHWLVPHFEKMLYDNAQLARAYLHAYLLTGNADYRQVCKDTLDFVLREMTHPQGGFFSSIDADSEGHEGLFYTWTYAELEQNLTPQEFDALRQAYTVDPQGNFEGRIILQTKADPETLARLEEPLDQARQKMMSLRDARVRPATDDKVLTAWNAWMATTFAEAARYLQRDDYLTAAQNNLTFIRQSLLRDGRLLRSWREGKADHTGYLEDYASLGLAAIALYQSDYDTAWFTLAQYLADQILTHFFEPEQGFFDTANDHETLLLRPQESQDNATPSGSSLAIQLLLTIATYTGESRYYQIAAGVLSPMQEVIASYPTAFANWLNALDFALAPVQEIAILGNLASSEARALLNNIWERYRPNSLLAASASPPSEDAPALLADRPLINGKPTAYVCYQFTCQAPTTNADILRAQLSNASDE